MCSHPFGSKAGAELGQVYFSLFEGDSLKLYQVEHRAIMTFVADNLQSAELDPSAFITENPHAIRVKGAH
jgi:hypothetical protein